MLRVLFLLISPCLVLAQPDKASVKVAKQWYTEDSEGVTHTNVKYGTGVVVFNGKTKKGKEFSLILTNAHVADEDANYSIFFADKQLTVSFVATVADAEREDKGDLALLWCETKLPVVNIAKEEPPKDALVTQWGYPGAGRLTKLSGPWIGQDGYSDRHRFANYLCTPGCSGSGICYKDQVVGLCYAISNAKDRNGNTIYQPDGKTPVFTAPTHVVPLKLINDFLLYHAAADMGFTVEKAPMPRVIPRNNR